MGGPNIIKLEDDFLDVAIQIAREDFKEAWENRTKTVDVEQDKKLKGKYKRLFKRIEHGNRNHRNWLYDEMLKFQEEEASLKNTPEPIEKGKEVEVEETPPLIGSDRVDYQWSGSSYSSERALIRF